LYLTAAEFYILKGYGYLDLTAAEFYILKGYGYLDLRTVSEPDALK
jgi:hypothetical protein